MLGLDRDLTVLEGGLADRWNDKPVAEINGNDIHTVVQEVTKRGVPGGRRLKQGTTESLARSMFDCLSKFFSWLVEHRRVTSNPCTGVWRPKPNAARERVLTDDEIRRLWEVDNAYVKLLLITGQRRDEVASMTGMNSMVLCGQSLALARRIGGSTPCPCLR